MSRLDALTGARFFAAFHVFIFHAWAARGFPTPFRKIDMAGHMAVAFFFVLSGFILAATYGTRGKFNVKDFAVARFARIYPLYALNLLVAAVLYFWTTGHGPNPSLAVVWLESLVLVQNWLPPSPIALSGVAWTLSAEAFFYLCFPALVAWTANWRPSTIYRVLAGVVLAYVVLRWVELPFANTAIIRLPEFFIGILMGRLYLEGILKDDERKATLLFYVAFLGTLVTPQFFALSSEKFAGIMAPLFGLMILCLSNSDALPARLLRSRALVFLGGASYALYLSHGFVLYGLNLVFEAMHRTRVGSGLTFALIASVASILVASALFVLIEEPSRKWLRKRLMTRRSPEASPENTALKTEPL